MSKVRCPVCGVLVKQKFIEGHIGGKHPKAEPRGRGPHVEIAFVPAGQDATPAFQSAVDIAAKPRGPRDGAASVQDKHGRDLTNG